MSKLPLDKRNKLWRLFEKKIQQCAARKDKGFVLEGKWKKFIREESGYKIFAVDGRWVTANLCVYFAHGGHGLVHEFIPMDEIWVTSHHYNEEEDAVFSCICETKSKGQKCSKNFFESTIVHEIVECEEMKKGNNYWKSHQIALAKEREIGLLVDPFDDR